MMFKQLTAALVVARAVSGQMVSNSTSSPAVIPTTTSGSPITSIAYSCFTTASAGSPFVTIYELTVLDVCPTGTIYSTYTITDTCGCTHSTDYVKSTGCPSGFTVTDKVCTACAGAPTIAVTVPINPSDVSQPTGSTNSNSTPVYTPGAPGTPGNSGIVGTAKPSIVTTGAATALSSDSILGSFMVLTMTFVAGLMWAL